jgi:glycosyltransferase involved in cell wall biosynthesis
LLTEWRSKEMPRIAAVIPAYNEAGRVGRVLETLPHELVDDIIVVDDHSTDGTAKESIKNGATQVASCRSHGVGAAIKAGYKEALRRRADIVLVLAGDGQHDPSEIPRIIQPIRDGEADYVVGDRLCGYQRGGGMSPLRFAGNKTLTLMTRAITGMDVRDSQCGYTAIARDALMSFDLERITDSWGVPNDFLVECSCRGLKVKYVRIKARPGFRRSYIRIYSYVPRMMFILVRGALRVARGKFGKGKMPRSLELRVGKPMTERQISIVSRHGQRSED